ncbi:MAG: hypothetical protein GYA17_18830, partial [Chloroflexi bacterium]|nr:hypothetical protein [Chloroflexota bacterium]
MTFGFASMTPSARRARLTAAVLITALALFLRVYLAAVGPIEYDEPVYVDAAIQYAADLRAGQWGEILDDTYNYEHPIFNKLLYAASLLPFKAMPVGTSMPFDAPLYEVPNYYKLLTLRLVSAVAGAGAVFVLSLVNPLAGLALAVHTFAVKYSSVIYLEAVPALASLLAVLAAQRAFHPRDGGGRAWLWLGGSALAMGVAAASKYMYGALALAVVVNALLQPGGRSLKTVRRLAVWALLCALFFCLCDPVLWPAPLARLLQSLQFSTNYSANDVVVNAKHYSVWQPLYWLLLSIPHHSLELSPFFLRPGNYFLLVDSLIFALAILGLPGLFKRYPAMFWWLAVGLVFLFAWRTKWPQYVMLILPAFCLSA